MTTDPAAAPPAIEEEEGSWIPFIVIVIVACVWWINYSQSSLATRARRTLGMQRVQLKKKFGLRDNSKYRDGAVGDGANQRSKRQG
jgi:hypothetical protein